MYIWGVSKSPYKTVLACKTNFLQDSKEERKQNNIKIKKKGKSFETPLLFG